MKNPDEAIEHYQLAKKDRTMNSEAEKLFGAISDWKSNDGWQFADKEAAWKFFFQAGAASRDAEVSDWRSQAHRSQSEADNAIAECAQLRAELAAIAKVRKP